jgi:hypothetical protein
MESFAMHDKTRGAAAISRNHIAFHPQLPMLVMGSNGGYVSCWDVTKPKKPQINFNHGVECDNTQFSFDSTGGRLMMACDKTLQMFSVKRQREDMTLLTPAEPVSAISFDGNPEAVKRVKHSTLVASNLTCFAVNPASSKYDILTGYSTNTPLHQDESRKQFTTGIILSCSSERCEEITSWPGIPESYKIKSLAFCYKPPEIEGVVFATGYKCLDPENSGTPKGMVQLCHHVPGTPSNPSSTESFTDEYTTDNEVTSISCHSRLPIIAVATGPITVILRYNPRSISDGLSRVCDILKSVNSVTFHPSLPILAIASSTKIELFFFNANSQCILPLKFDMNVPFDAVAFHPNPSLNYMAAVSRGSTYVWDISLIVRKLLSKNPFMAMMRIFGNMVPMVIQRLTELELVQGGDVDTIVLPVSVVKKILSRVVDKTFPADPRFTIDSLYDIMQLFFVINPIDSERLPFMGNTKNIRQLFSRKRPRRGGSMRRNTKNNMKTKKLNMKKRKTKKTIMKKLKLRNKSVNRRNRK